MKTLLLKKAAHQASCVNIGCGPVYLKSTQWLNLDYISNSDFVFGCNLSRPLPLPSNKYELVYSSHLLEHLNYDQAIAHLKECYRILKPGGILRLSTPDLINMCREYISMRDTSSHENAETVLIELLDQITRSYSGGRAYLLYKSLASNLSTKTSKIKTYVEARTGEKLSNYISPVNRGINIFDSFLRLDYAFWIGKVISDIRITAGLAILPSSFRSTNVSSAAIGELHKWIWDYHQLLPCLDDIGFVNVSRASHQYSNSTEFPFQLDCHSDGTPRKGLQSMYIEAFKPISPSPNPCI